MGRLVLENVSKNFASPGGDSTITAVDRFSLDVQDGKLLVLLGPSGCGKTTLLRLIAGLETPSTGQILLDGHSFGQTPSQQRPIGMAFQYPALLPQLTVRHNVALGPKLRGASPAETQERVRRIAQLLGITEILDRAPETLSGGQQQRVSLARAVAIEPAVLLLDEPLANLDPVSRSELRDAIRALQRQLGVTTIYVTHDQNEAAAISDEIVVMNLGAIQQVGIASDLYQNPGNLFVAEFFDLDRPNVFPATIRDRRLYPDGADCEFPVQIAVEGKATCVLRQRAIRPDGPIQGRIEEVQHTGWSTRVTLNFSGFVLRGEIPFSPRVNTGESYSFGIQANDLLLFDSTTGTRIRD